MTITAEPPSRGFGWQQESLPACMPPCCLHTTQRAAGGRELSPVTRLAQQQSQGLHAGGAPIGRMTLGRGRHTSARWVGGSDAVSQHWRPAKSGWGGFFSRSVEVVWRWM